MSNTFVRKSNLERLKKAYETKDSSGFRFWKPQKNGEYTMRFLPPVQPDGLFYKEAKQHKLGENYFFCPKPNNEPCPICDLYKKLWKIGSPEAIALAREIKPRRQYLYNVIIRSVNKDDYENPTKVQVYMSGKKLYDLVLSYFFNTDYGDLTDVENGFDFVIVKEDGEGGFPSYAQSHPRRQPSPLAVDDKTINEILSNLKDLNGEVDVLPYDALKKELEKYINDEKKSVASDNAAISTTSVDEDSGDDEAETQLQSEASVEDSKDLDDFEKKLLAQLETPSNPEVKPLGT